MFHLRPMGKMKRYDLLTNSINWIDLCVAGIKMQIYPTFVSDLDQSNTLQSVLYKEKLAVGQQIIPSRNMITQKKSLVTIILSIRPGQFINRFYNARSPIMKVLKMIINVLLNILEIYQLTYTMIIYRNLSHYLLSQSNYTPFLAS